MNLKELKSIFKKAEPEEKVNFSPPGWLVYHFELKLQPEKAKRFQNFRQRICDAADHANHSKYPFLELNELLTRAVDLLLTDEDRILEEIKKFK